VSDAPAVRRAGPEDADAVARLLHDFNREYDEPTPGPPALAARLRELHAGGDFVVLTVGADAARPEGLAVLRLRPSLWSTNLECHLAELYVVPARRGRGLGRALLQEAIAVARAEGADHMDLGTSEDDVAARGLYESAGFTRHEGGPDGPLMSVYEREL
jgi:ribosomal protein S18 acetylase RimI-like enzyme